MWAFKETINHADTTLSWAQTGSIAPQGISALNIIITPGKAFLLNLTINPDRHNAIKSILEQFNESVLSNDTKTLLIVCINSSDNHSPILALLYKLQYEIPNFDQIRTQLQPYLNLTKQAAIANTQQLRLESLQNKEKAADNNMMLATVFFSARQAELALRAKVNFPAPFYASSLHEAVDTVTEASMDPATAALMQQILIDNSNAYEIKAHDISEYTTEENELIKSLFLAISIHEKFYIENGYLSIKTEAVNVSTLSQAAQPLINTVIPSINDKMSKEQIKAAKSLEKRIDAARDALNVWAALDAIRPHGSHSHNGNMVQTKIIGYGMRNILALVWKACIHAEANNVFNPGITMAHALKAIITGIANGARDGNRNLPPAKRVVFDDIKPSSRNCDQGRYNDLFKELDAIFPNINIVYDIESALHDFIRLRIIDILLELDYVKTYALALNYLKIWRNGMEEQEKPMGCRLFEQTVKQRFDSLLEEFLVKNYGNNPDAKIAVRTEITKQIDALKQASLSSYIELIVPTDQQLSEKWYLKYPRRIDTPIPELESKRIKLRNTLKS